VTDIDATPAPEPAPAEADDNKMNWIELCAAILLGIAGVLTAYAAYNGSLADGDALKGYTQSSRTTADANGFYTDYAGTYNADQALFLQYQLLVERGEQDTADVVKDNLFSDALTVATDAWLAIPEGEGPPTPLDTEEYVIEAFDTANQLTEQAEAEFTAAQQVDDDGDNFDLATVFLAVSLFFAGIAALFKVRKIQIAMLIGALALLVPGIQAIATGKGWG
jgi:hypothetical protein